MINIAIVIFSIVLCVVTIILHSIGSYYLISLYRHGDQGPEQLLLINVSLSGLVFTIAHVLLTPIETLMPVPESVVETLVSVQAYLTIFDGYGGLIYYVCMIYLSIDRLLDIALNIKYHLYCNINKTTVLLRATWGIGLFITFALMFMHGFTDYDVINALAFIYPAFDFVFVVIAFTVYGFLFHKYRLSRLPPARQALKRTLSVQRSASDSMRPTVFQVFQTSRFHMPVCLIGCFLICIVVPDFLYLIMITGVDLNFEVVSSIYNFSFVASCFVDAIIYIFMSPSLKRVLLKKIRIYRSTEYCNGRTGSKSDDETFIRSSHV